MEKVNKNFLAELFKKIFISKEMMGIVNDFVDFKVIPTSEIGYKVILKEAKKIFREEEMLPSMGVISQRYGDNADVMLAIDQIKSADEVESELLITQLEHFIRKNSMLVLAQEVVSLWNDSKFDEAIELQMKRTEEIHSFSLRNESGKFISVFKGFDETRVGLQNEEEEKPKLPFGIDALDNEYGGREVGDTSLWIMRSGVGKSTVLRWLGFTAALNGYPVLHIQAEEDKHKIRVKYTQMFANKSYGQLKRNDFTEKELQSIKSFVKDTVDYCADIDIYSFKKFGEATVIDIRNIIIEYGKIHGYYPRLVIIDSFDLIYTGFNKQADQDPKPKARMQLVAQRLKNIAEEFSLNIDTATQTGDVPFEHWNDPEKVIDRSHAEGDRTSVKPFSWVLTGNQTLSEKEAGTFRIFKDKVRDYSNDRPVFMIKSKYEYGRFYDRSATFEAFGEDSFVAISSETKKPKRKREKGVEKPLEEEEIK